MIKKLVLVFTVLFAIQLKAQEGITTTSPYSFYGIGSLKFKGTVENRSMGGLSIYKDSIHINLRNPAMYGDNNIEVAPFNGESRAVKFTVGGSRSSTKLSTETGSDRANTTTFDYLALYIPIKKLGFGFGLLPYTSVGYKLENSFDDGFIKERFEGVGGINKAYFSLGYQITKELSFGVDANYNFGNIENSVILFDRNDEGDYLQFQSKENNRSDLSGLNYNFGMHYKKIFANDIEIQSGVTYSPQSDINSNNERTFSTITFDVASGNDVTVNSIDFDLKSVGLEKTNLTLPSKFSLGFGLGEQNKWFAGLEYTSLNTSEFENPLYNQPSTTYEDNTVISIGGFYVPDHKSFSSYWKRVVFRAGTRFENTGLIINNQSIKEFGMSFGVGLPAGRNFSNANIGFEIGERGTTFSGLIEEKFINLQISLSLNDRWFNKRKYN